jgi:hypothetical protein
MEDGFQMSSLLAHFYLFYCRAVLVEDHRVYRVNDRKCLRIRIHSSDLHKMPYGDQGYGVAER